MKLVEILARDWAEWPIGTLAVRQTAGGNMTDNSEIIFRPVQGHAEDQETAVVTRAQWEAERARIAAMEGISAAPEKSNAEAERDPQAQYEQELWDKVAANALSGVIAAYTDDDVKNNIAHSFEYADAFMAERAKRLKGVK